MSKPLDQPPKFLELFPINDFMVVGGFVVLNVPLFLILSHFLGFVFTIIFCGSACYGVFWFFIIKNKMPRGFFSFVLAFKSKPRLLLPGRERSQIIEKKGMENG